MADPRIEAPQARKANHSPLMLALIKRQSEQSGPANFCPFGCEDADLDEHGYCAHLVGFTNGGGVYEPRVRLPSGRVVVDGDPYRRVPLKKGHRLVRITTSARVYSPVPDDALAPPKNPEHEEALQALERENELIRLAEQVRNPVLEGEWDGPSVYAEEVGKGKPGKRPKSNKDDPLA